MGGDWEGSDEALWQRVVNGDGEAFGAVFDRHRDRVFRHCVKLVGSAHGAEDITAMVFYEAWRRREYVRVVNDSIVAWLLVTANYTIKNDLRQRRRYRNFLNRLPQPANSPDVADAFIDAADQDHEAATLQEAFTRLRPAERDILTLCVVEDMSIRDAATALGIAEGTVKSRLNRAKTRLGHLYNEISSDQAISPQAIQGRRTT
jgi:RNA polymerase sigma-70 factor (ECF subfamily)